MRNIIFYLILAISFSFCTSAYKDDTSNTLTDRIINPVIADTTQIRKGAITQKTLNFNYPDFESFYLQFISDSLFQISRVKFPLRGLYQDYDNEVKWTKSKWPLLKWDIRKRENQDDSISLIQTNNRVFYGTYCLDCGFSFELEFNKFNEKWFLTYRQENNY
jgi:hypothetical protein